VQWQLQASDKVMESLIENDEIKLEQLLEEWDREEEGELELVAV